jgi:carbonic anhydrase/acetyltransferase-like protein (isoleucine patch superfamily)
MAIYQLGAYKPSIDIDAYVAHEATIIGKVTIQARASVWPGAVLRGDNEEIVVGAGSSVQEGVVLHTDHGCPLILGRYVTIGHQAVLHGCTIEDGALIGIGAIVLDRAVVGKESLVGARSLITEGKVFPPRSLILGTPARVMRPLTDAEVARLYEGAAHYAEVQAAYGNQLRRIAQPVRDRVPAR